MEAVFVDGVPAKITVYDFLRHHLQSFPSFSDSGFTELIQEAIDTVYTMFVGVGTAWDLQDKQVWFDKSRRCYLYLTAWLIADQYPELTASIVTIAGIKRKKIDGIDITFDPGIYTDKDPLVWLKSNAFGRKVLMMAGTLPRRALLRVEKYV